MAKKKTAEKAKIEATPVLRAQGEDESTPETPIVTKSYSMRDDWKDKGIVNYVAFKSVDGEVQDLMVNGESVGGGGASLVKVTIINNTAEDLEVTVANLIGDQVMLPAHMEGFAYIDANSSLEIDALTLEEYSKIFAIGSYNIAVTGEITKDVGTSLQIATIHGPGTVTFTQAE